MKSSFIDGGYEITTVQNSDKSGLQLNKIIVNEDYKKKWNETLNDFFVLTLNGVLLRDTLYRIGGLNNPKVGQDNYFLLIKHVEAHYPKEIMEMSKSNRTSAHLESRWCIIDKEGNEKVVFEHFQIPYLVQNSIIYSLDGEYFNIETGERYGQRSNSIESKDFIFLENKYDKDISKRGVMKINKKDGTYEIFEI